MRHKKPSIEEIKQKAISKRGRCLSDSYINAKTLMQWECENKHPFKAVWNNIQQGKWCPDCAGNTTKNIADMRELAKKKNGKCLSKKYKGSHVPLNWQCEKGHRWPASPTNVKQGQWCPKCGRNRAANKLRGNIYEIKQIAIDRGGECLSEEYVNSQADLKFKCKNNHQWDAPGNRIKQGGWCPDCSDSLGERICREFLEQVFQKKFPKSYPKWLSTELGAKLELDGYCKELCLAFEHHGQQHYKSHPYHHRTPQEFALQVKRDKHKKKLCSQHKVKLIIIPELFTLTKLKNLSEVMQGQFDINKIMMPVDTIISSIDVSKAYYSEDADKALELMREIALSKNGRCLSLNYIASDQKLDFLCEQGHNFSSIPDNIKAGHWCKFCSGNQKLTLKKMQEIAAAKGGKCLSIEYINSHTHLIWECKEKHIFPSSPSNIMHSNAWCNDCKKKVKGNKPYFINS